MRRVVRLLALAAVVLAAHCGAPAAQAVSPPPVDDKWLPRPALPAPPRPTVQREVCAPIPAEADADATHRAGPPAQLAGLDLAQVWALTRGAGQRIAVIDTGVARHPRLPNVVAGGDYVSTGDGTQDCDAHGTMVAGIIAAAEDSRSDKFSGLAPDATVVSIRQSSAKFAPADRSTAGFGDVDTMAKAVRTAADLGASVINISTVACVANAADLDDRALGAALAYAVDVKNAVVVAAAGNTGGTTQCPPQRPNATWDTVTVAVSPAWYDDYVLAVGSVNADGAPSAFTMSGPWVDVAAVGEGVSALGSTPLSGTSYAAPLVSALAALIRSRFPALTAREVMQRIASTAHHPSGGRDPLVGNGTIDVVAALSTTALPPPAARPDAARVPAARPAPGPPDRHARNTALRGAAICLGVLLAALAVSAASRRSRRSRGDGVAGD